MTAGEGARIRVRTGHSTARRNSSDFFVTFLRGGVSYLQSDEHDAPGPHHPMRAPDTAYQGKEPTHG